MSKVKYTHLEEIHNLQDPEIIVPVIMDIIRPNSIVDVGCGTGTFLHVFKKFGVDKILGLDGDWVNRELLAKHIDLQNFKVVDIEKGFEIEGKFDLAVCLEVMEHIDETYLGNALRSLTKLSDIILFSAAIPGQQGQNHVNEQWPDYWEEKFRIFEFHLYDVLRPIFWNHPVLASWYKQNIFLAVKTNCYFNLEAFIHLQVGKTLLSLIHPDYYESRICEINELKKEIEIKKNYLNFIKNGNAPIFFYLKLVIKSFLSRMRKHKRNLS